MEFPQPWIDVKLGSETVRKGNLFPFIVGLQTMGLQLAPVEDAAAVIRALRPGTRSDSRPRHRQSS
jgi:hypothetical protein